MRPGMIGLVCAAGVLAWYLRDVAAARSKHESHREAPVVVPALQQLAGRWVGTLDSLAPRAFLAYSTDAFGDLYVVPGAWFAALTPNEQCAWHRQYEARWRAYLRATIGAWDSTSAFAPRLVAVDSDGPVACGLPLHTH